MQTSAKIIIIAVIVAVLAGTWAYKNTAKTAALPKPVTTEGTSINASPEKEITKKTRTTVTMTYGKTKEDIVKNTKIIQEITTLDKKNGKKTLYTITTIKKKNKDREISQTIQTNPTEIN